MPRRPSANRAPNGGPHPAAGALLHGPPLAAAAPPIVTATAAPAVTGAHAYEWALEKTADSAELVMPKGVDREVTYTLKATRRPPPAGGAGGLAVAGGFQVYNGGPASAAAPPNDNSVLITGIRVVQREECGPEAELASPLGGDAGGAAGGGGHLLEVDKRLSCTYGFAGYSPQNPARGHFVRVVVAYVDNAEVGGPIPSPAPVELDQPVRARRARGRGAARVRARVHGVCRCACAAVRVCLCVCVCAHLCACVHVHARCTAPGDTLGPSHGHHFQTHADCAPCPPAPARPPPPRRSLAAGSCGRAPGRSRRPLAAT